MTIYYNDDELIHFWNPRNKIGMFVVTRMRTERSLMKTGGFNEESIYQPANE